MRINRKTLAWGTGIALLILLLVAGIHLTQNPSESKEIIRKYGYFGVFLAVLLTNLTLLVGIPTPTYIFLAVAAGLDPFITTLVAAIASAFGESTGYFLGLGGRKIIERKYGEILGHWRYLFHKYGFFTIVVISALPFPPDDIAGILAGSVGYDYRKFLFATFLGKFVKYGLTAALTVVGIKIFNHVFYD